MGNISLRSVAEGLGDIENTTIEIKSRVRQTNEEEVSFYRAFDHFQVENGISENNEEIFYGSVFHDFNEQWQARKRMGYDESKMKSMKYKMVVYDEFLKEYEYRKNIMV